MNRLLIKSSAFVRTAKRVLKKNPNIWQWTFKQRWNCLQKMLFITSLKTHKLKGNLEGSWACGVVYDLRIIFEFVQHDESEAILLEAIGSHDEVY